MACVLISWDDVVNNVLVTNGHEFGKSSITHPYDPKKKASNIAQNNLSVIDSKEYISK